VSHAGFGAKYQSAWYNPGDPPWEGYPNSGWGGDHTGPTGLACVPAGIASAWRVIISSEVAEGGDAVFALDANDKKVWVQARLVRARGPCASRWKRVPRVVAAQHAAATLCANGRAVPFQRPAGIVDERSTRFGGYSIAVSADRIAVVLAPDEKTSVKTPKLVFFDKIAVGFQKEVALAQLGTIGLRPARSIVSEQRRYAGDAGRRRERDTSRTARLAKPVAFCFDADGSLDVNG